ncbi:nucleolar protein 12-domain-containing protein [Myxozyma melibiosi]|uniref:Nucleolar protein 12-domain-containing protein n=1 Tax=Myxozyma melibiosi TaxID=54550 RepID=A0ABR1F1Q5_9ASCO
MPREERGGSRGGGRGGRGGRGGGGRGGRGGSSSRGRGGFTRGGRSDSRGGRSDGRGGRGGGRGGGSSFRGGRGRGSFADSRVQRRPREIVFDKEAREEYLTGFHKRNVERREKAIAKAVEHEKEERREERQVLRQRRKQELEERVEFAKNLYGGSELDLGYDSSDAENGDSDADLEAEEWHGIQDETDASTSAAVEENKASIDKQDEINGILKTGKKVVQTYDAVFTEDTVEDDEGQTTTVEIESYDITNEQPAPSTSLTVSSARSGTKEFQSDEEILHKSLLRAALYAERVKKINNGIPVPPKQKKKKFRYLTSQERKVNTVKERTKGRR